MPLVKIKKPDQPIKGRVLPKILRGHIMEAEILENIERKNTAWLRGVWQVEKRRANQPVARFLEQTINELNENTRK